MNEYVESKVAAPGISLAAVGALAVLVNLLSLLLQVVFAATAVMALLGSDATTGADWMGFATSQGWQILMSTIGFLVGFIVLMAGLRLRSARSAGLVYAGSIFAMLPCCISYCCCLGLPVGLWAIMTMQDDQVRAAFAEG